MGKSGCAQWQGMPAELIAQISSREGPQRVCSAHLLLQILGTSAATPDGSSKEYCSKLIQN